MREINLDDQIDRWRYTCPRGHRNWEATNNHFWCCECARQKGVDGVFHELRDAKDRELLSRDEVRLITSAGPYRDVHGEEPV
ncbi:hypothetical protein [Halobaculum gomorrense]|uniref:Uncharacterized protein n=1 Tax=Halobaculum gomorrense TaxID=43928 RepID=A0A1M5MJX1_9EURY|nr:hypothetical protein [Halobaculum gomorrense]SHG77794.1 hypothetical protein SAMN05443636_1045 [Halobaculum gomorrense]